jgi:hypothetical protein
MTRIVLLLLAVVAAFVLGWVCWVGTDGRLSDWHKGGLATATAGLVVLLDFLSKAVAGLLEPTACIHCGRQCQCPSIFDTESED